MNISAEVPRLRPESARAHALQMVKEGEEEDDLSSTDEEDDF